MTLSTAPDACSCQCHGQGWQAELCPGRHSSPPPPPRRHRSAPWQPQPPTQQSRTNDFDLSSAVRGRSYRYNPANDVKDLSAKLMNDKNSPPLSTPFTLLLLTLKKTPLQQARKIESQETLLISVPCILTLTFLNRSSGYKGPEQQLLCAKMWLKAFWKVEERD